MKYPFKFAIILFLFQGCCTSYDNFEPSGSLNLNEHELIVNMITQIDGYPLPRISYQTRESQQIRSMMLSLGVNHLNQQWQLDTILRTLDSTRKVPVFDFTHFILIPYSKVEPDVYSNEIEFQPVGTINHETRTIKYSVNTKGRHCSSGLNSSYSPVEFSGWLQLVRPPVGYSVIIIK